jgi:hypothetical protein
MRSANVLCRYRILNTLIWEDTPVVCAILDQLREWLIAKTRESAIDASDFPKQLAGDSLSGLPQSEGNMQALCQ